MAEKLLSGHGTCLQGMLQIQGITCCTCRCTGAPARPPMRPPPPPPPASAGCAPAAPPLLLRPPGRSAAMHACTHALFQSRGAAQQHAPVLGWVGCMHRHALKEILFGHSACIYTHSSGCPCKAGTIYAHCCKAKLQAAAQRHDGAGANPHRGKQVGAVLAAVVVHPVHIMWPKQMSRIMQYSKLQHAHVTISHL